MASSSVRLICWESFADRNQQASSTTAPSYTSDTLIYKWYTKSLAIGAPSAPRRVFLVPSSENLFNHGVERGVVNFVIPSSGDVRCSLLDECHSYTKPTIHGRCPTNLPHNEKTLHRMTTQGMPGILFPLLQYREWSSPQTCNPSTHAPSVASPVPCWGGPSCRDAPSHMPQAQCSRPHRHHQ